LTDSGFEPKPEAEPAGDPVRGVQGVRTPCLNLQKRR